MKCLGRRIGSYESWSVESESTRKRWKIIDVFFGSPIALDFDGRYYRFGQLPKGSFRLLLLDLADYNILLGVNKNINCHVSVGD